MDSSQKIDNFVKIAKKNGFNTLFVQVCGRGIAYYDSNILPRKDPDFDGLAYTVEKSHSAGLKVHAWINAFYVWSSSEAPEDSYHVVNLRPDWLLSPKKMLFLDPSIREVRDHVRDVYLEVAEKYDVDGLHMDYIRYPGPGPADEIEARCENVTSLVSEIRSGLDRLDKGIKLSAAVYPNIVEARRDIGQDWLLWIKSGLIDFIVPMIYTTNVDKVKDRVLLDASLSRKKDTVLAGLGAYMVTAEDLIKQIKVVNHYKKYYGSLSGVCLFSYDAVSSEAFYLEKIRKYAF